ncbi:MAG: zinc transporter ZntB [Akkermansiaceae bacterium]|nr:zinc transporter ZntB [Akkermansiaceae bacterium]NNM29733.1 zinc transporter ZntB [Akkermansiaceae bacterium]
MTTLPHGLRHACLLDGRGGLASFDPGQLDTWDPAAGPLWLHCDLTDPAAQEWITNHSGLEPVAIEALLTVESRPRVTRIGDGALLAFRGVNLNEGSTPDDMIGIRLWVDEHRVISTFRRNLRSVDDVEADLRDGSGPDSTSGILTDLATRLVARMSDTVDNLEEQIAELEEQVLEGTSRETRFALANLRRQVIALRRYLAPQREALASLVASKLPWITDAHRLALRETSDRLIRHLEDLDAIRERAAVTQEEVQSRLAEQQNVRMYVLSIVAAIFLPLGFLTGLLGINVGGIPGAEDPHAFTVFLLILGAIVTAQFLFFRFRKWF